MDKSTLFETLWGSTVGDAIGNPLEFMSNVSADQVRRLMGTNLSLRISDDTQMTLFEYEALHHGWTPDHAIRRWYLTQTGARRVPGDMGLLQFDTLFCQEAPGMTCMSAASALYGGTTVRNDSKGNGTVMRAAPFAVAGFLNGVSRDIVLKLAKEDALLTHKHPYAWSASVALCDILYSLFEGRSWDEAIQSMYFRKPLGMSNQVACQAYRCWESNDAFDKYLHRRSGWTAEEALAMAVGAVSMAYDCQSDPDEFYRQSITNACIGVATDSDTVASIAGTLAVAAGARVPKALKTRLNAKKAIQYIIDMYD